MTEWQLGVSAFKEGRMREAADRLQTAFEERELTVSQAVRYETAAYLGAALYALGQPANALPAFEAAQQLAPANKPSADLLMNLVHAYLAAGRTADARAALHRLTANAPGHVAANMLAARLDTLPAQGKVTGAVLGISPETAASYIRTLTFSRVTAGGYDSAEVQEALSQLQRYIVGLSAELKRTQDELIQADAEIARYREMEDAVVENMMQFQPSAQASGDDAEAGLSPIEILFRQKT